MQSHARQVRYFNCVLKISASCVVYLLAIPAAAVAPFLFPPPVGALQQLAV